MSARQLANFGFLAGLLGFVALSGLAIWLLPFSLAAELLVLAHTVVGLCLVVPLSIWVYHHILNTRHAPRRRGKIFGTLGAAVLLITVVTGLVLTWEASRGLRIRYTADQLHLWIGLLAILLVGGHAWPARKKKVVATEPATAPVPAMPAKPPNPYVLARHQLWRRAGVLFVAGLIVFAVGALLWPVRHYAWHLPKDYKFTYGPNPYAPSFATTIDGKPVNPALIAGSSSCGSSGCHSEIYREWQASAHRWGSEDTLFQGVQTRMIREAGAPATRYCAGCHDPVSLLSGYKDASRGINAPGFKEGDSCVSCHAMRKVDVQGNANYVFAAPKPYLFNDTGSAVGRMVNHFLIRAYPRQHERDFDVALVQRPESCAACHKQFIDKRINHVGWVQLQNQYDDWKHGKWNADKDPKRNLRCQQCHMYYQKAPTPGQADPADLQAGMGLLHRTHYFAGGNQFMPEEIHTPDAAAQTQREIDWLQGKKVIPEIASIWPRGPVMPIRIVAPATAKPGEPIKFLVLATNNKAGHSVPTGPSDLIRCWVQVTVTDDAGAVVYHSGWLNAEHHIEPGSFVFKGVGVNAAGQEILVHDLWHEVGAKGKRAVFPGYTDMNEYHFTPPASAKGGLHIQARLLYTKANQTFMDITYPGQHRHAPITELSPDQALISRAAQGGRQ